MLLSISQIIAFQTHFKWADEEEQKHEIQQTDKVPTVTKARETNCDPNCGGAISDAPEPALVGAW